MLNDGTVDWAAGEMFAFGSLLLEVVSVTEVLTVSGAGTTGAFQFGSLSGSVL